MRLPLNTYWKRLVALEKKLDGFDPRLEEITKAFGYKSKSAIMPVLEQMIKAGLVKTRKHGLATAYRAKQ